MDTPVPKKRSPIRSYEDIEVYQRSMTPMKDTHAFAAALPPNEQSLLGDQMRRGSRSVPTNIAEGYARRGSAREFRRYLTIAMGSANERKCISRLPETLDLRRSQSVCG